MDEHIVDVDLAYFVDQAVKDLVLHSALKERAQLLSVLWQLGSIGSDHQPLGKR